MKKAFLLATCLVIIFLAGCQSAAPSPTPQPSELPLPTTPPFPTETLPIPTPTTAIEPIKVTAFCTTIGKDSKTYVPQGTPVIIIWGWEAKTEAQIDDFLENNLTTITLDGKAIEGTLNEKVTKNEKSGLPEVAWFADVGVLDAGQHVITYDVKWKKMIDDGANTYGPGSKNETLHDECQIIVQ